MFISYEDRLADTVRRKYGLQNQNPLDMIYISNSEGISLESLENPSFDNASGQFDLVYRMGRLMPVIRINPYRSLTHQRFTFAHELGHYFLQHGPRNRDTGEQLQKREPEEMAANRFAAGLLMPVDAVQNAVKSGISVYQMPGLFGVSEEAMSYRLRNLGF